MPRSFLALALVCALAGTAGPAFADPEPSESAIEAARTDFAEGQGHFRTKRWSDALKAFERSYAHVASPNVQLMIARCLRELGRGPDAAAAFASTETEARRRVKNGEAKYEGTAEAAASEGSALRAGLGTLKIHVARSSGATLTVDRKNVALSKDGDATLFHDPGAVSVSLRDAAGAEQRQTVTVSAGSTAEMEFVVAEPKVSLPPLATTPIPPPPPPAEEKSRPSWMWPAAIATGIVTVGAAGVGVGFGANSKATFDALVTSCGAKGCSSAADRASADAGQRDQTIANIGFGVAIAGVLATAVILYLGLTSDHRASKANGI